MGEGGERADGALAGEQAPDEAVVGGQGLADLGRDGAEVFLAAQPRGGVGDLAHRAHEAVVGALGLLRLLQRVLQLAHAVAQALGLAPSGWGHGSLEAPQT
ncbi:MAG: hypothetical protein QM765_28395 [Myxococcales bacterium]